MRVGCVGQDGMWPTMELVEHQRLRRRKGHEKDQGARRPSTERATEVLMTLSGKMTPSQEKGGREGLGLLISWSTNVKLKNS